MSIELNEEQRMWQDTLNTFMEKEVGREYTRAHDASREFPWEVYRKMGELGWLGLLLPEEDGGVEADPIMFAIFCEAIAKYSLDTAACMMTSMFTATNISAHGTPAQKEKYLPAFLRGERTFSIAITEPQSGSDAAAARTKATRDGNAWVLNGSKTFCSGAHIPGTAIVLLARTGEERYKGLSMFILPNDAPGLTVTKLNTIVRRSLGTTQLYLDNVRLSDENLLGEIGEGWTYIGEHLEHERLSLAASYIGNAKTALDDTIRYTKDRKAFGRSISEFQVLKHRMVDSAIGLEAAQLLTYSAAQKMVRGERAVKEVSMAKLFAADTHLSHQHCQFNSTCDLQGDTAHTETYYMFVGMNRKGVPLAMSGGRYIDRLEKRNGRWAIAARVCVRDWAPLTEIPETLDQASLTVVPLDDATKALMRSGAQPARDRTDPSYQRPLKGRLT